MRNDGNLPLRHSQARLLYATRWSILILKIKFIRKVDDDIFISWNKIGSESSDNYF